MDSSSINTIEHVFIYKGCENEKTMELRKVACLKK